MAERDPGRRARPGRRAGRARLWDRLPRRTARHLGRGRPAGVLPAGVRHRHRAPAPWPTSWPATVGSASVMADADQAAPRCCSASAAPAANRPPATRWPPAGARPRCGSPPRRRPLAHQPGRAGVAPVDRPAGAARSASSPWTPALADPWLSYRQEQARKRREVAEREQALRRADEDDDEPATSGTPGPWKEAFGQWP